MDQVLQYLKNSEKILKANEFPSDEEYEMFMQNVFSELDGMEYRLVCSHDGSSLVEKFLSSASRFQLRVFFDRLAGKYEAMAGHRYASHVLETIFTLTAKFLKESNDEEEEKSTDGAGDAGVLLSLPDLILRCYEELKKSVIDGVMDVYGSHVWRAVLNLLSTEAMPESFTKSVKDLSVSLREMDEGNGQGFRDLALHQYASPFLQSLFDALSKVGSKDEITLVTSKMFYGILTPGSNDDSLRSSAKKFFERAVKDSIGSRTIEAVIKHLDSQQYYAFYSNLVRGNVAKMLNDGKANFCIQQLVGICFNESQFDMLVGEMKDSFATLVEYRRCGVLVKMAEWAVTHKACFAQVMSGVFDAFHLKSNEDKVLSFSAVLRLQTRQNLSVNVKTTPAMIAAQGCMLLGSLAKFPSEVNKSVVDGLLKLSDDELIMLAKHQSGSRVLEAFLIGGSLSDKAITRLVRQFKGSYGQVAVDKYGSHVIEKCWKLSALQAKNAIMEELLASRQRLEETPQGRLVLKNCRVDQFGRKRDEWVEEEKSKERKRSLFDDILNDDGMVSAPASTDSKKSKKPKKTDEEKLLLAD